MAVWHYKTGGTRAFASGASIADDWTDANCFDSDATTLTEWWRVLSTAMADGDTLIFYDEADGVTLVQHSIEKGSTLNSTTPGTMTITSRSGDPNQCSIRASTDNEIVNHNNNAQVVNYIYEGLSISGPADGFSEPSRMFIQASGLTGNLTLNNCILGNIVMKNASLNQQGMIFANGEGRIITMHNCIIENVTTSGYQGGVWACQIDDGDLLNITGTLAIRNCNISAAGETDSAFDIDGDINITADVTIDNITLHTDGASTKAGSIFRCALTSHSSVTGSITVNNITATGGAAGCCVFKTSGTFDVNNITGKNISITQAVGENSVGALCLAIGVTAIGTFRNILAEDIDCHSGSAVYFSDGASGTAESIIARRCNQTETGVIYSGGYGSTIFRGFLVEDCASQNPGGAIFGHNHLAGGASIVDKTVTLENGTIINCQGNLNGNFAAGDGNAMWFNTPDSNGKTLTINIKNVVCRNGGDEEILFTENATETLDANVLTCDVEGGAPAINHADIVTGTYTEDTITDDSTQINANGTLTKDAAYKSAGLFVRYGSKDANGRMLGLPPPIGGFGRTSCSADTRNPRL